MGGMAWGVACPDQSGLISMGQKPPDCSLDIRLQLRGELQQAFGRPTWVVEKVPMRLTQDCGRIGQRNTA